MRKISQLSIVLSIAAVGFAVTTQYLMRKQDLQTASTAPTEVSGVSAVSVANESTDEQELIAQADTFPPVAMAPLQGFAAGESGQVRSSANDEKALASLEDDEEDLDDEEDEEEEDNAADEEEEDSDEIEAEEEKARLVKKKAEVPDIAIWGVEGWSLKLRAGAFFPTSSTFRRAYRNSAPNIQLEGSVKFLNDCFHAWGNVDIFFQRGSNHSCTGCKRVGNMVNFSTGLKWVNRFAGDFEGHLGIGPSFGWIDIWVDPTLSCEHRTFRQWAVGGIVKSGLYYYVTPAVFFEFFFDYLYQPTRWQGRTIDVGGVKSGIGVGVSL
jgi:hypothetical protein